LAAKTERVFRSFVKGLITEASPLTFPENASIDEQNFVLNRDGSRSRRLGIDYESLYAKTSTGLTAADIQEGKQSFHRWDTPSGNSSIAIGVVRIKDKLWFVDLLTNAQRLINNIITAINVKLNPALEDLGSIIGEKVLGFLQSFVEVLTGIVNAIEKLFGFAIGRIREDIKKRQDDRDKQLKEKDSIQKELEKRFKPTGRADNLHNQGGLSSPFDATNALLASNMVDRQKNISNDYIKPNRVVFEIGDIVLNVTEGSAKNAGMDFANSFADHIREIVLTDATLKGNR